MIASNLDVLYARLGPVAKRCALRLGLSARSIVMGPRVAAPQPPLTDVPGSVCNPRIMQKPTLTEETLGSTRWRKPISKSRLGTSEDRACVKHLKTNRVPPVRLAARSVSGDFVMMCHLQEHTKLAPAGWLPQFAACRRGSEKTELPNGYVSASNC